MRDLRLKVAKSITPATLSDFCAQESDFYPFLGAWSLSKVRRFVLSKHYEGTTDTLRWLSSRCVKVAFWVRTKWLWDAVGGDTHKRAILLLHGGGHWKLLRLLGHRSFITSNEAMRTKIEGLSQRGRV